jgi:hypothetical protein
MSIFKHHVFRKNNQLNLNDECLLGVIQELNGSITTDIRNQFDRYTRDPRSSKYINSIDKLTGLNFVVIKQLNDNKRKKHIFLSEDGLGYIATIKSFYE